jgi:ubiquinone/menaquinone biosynthesis C-methylase UbiE
MLKELYRVTTKSGIIVISVFGYQQKSNIYKDQDILLDYCVPQFKTKK